MLIFLIKHFFIIFSLLFPFFTTQAKPFQNDYLSFEIPETWTCKPFDQNWVCHDKYQNKKVEALITVTAKIAGDFDTQDNYLKYLQQEKTWTSRSQEQITSKKLGEPKYIYPNKFPWVESTHLNSEIKSYISRYAGTVCCEKRPQQLGILVVLSAHENLWSKYAPIFIKAINSLRVLDIEKAISKVRAADSKRAGNEMASYIDTLFKEDLEEAGQDSSSPLNSPFNLALLGIGLLALLALFILKKKARAKKRRRKLRRRRRHKSKS